MIILKMRTQIKKEYDMEESNKKKDSNKLDYITPTFNVKIDIKTDYTIHPIEDTLNEKEKLLIRKGNVLNTVGVIRCLYANNGQLTKPHYKEIVKANYMVSELDEKLENKLNEVWEKAKLTNH